MALSNQTKRHANLRWVSLGKMRVSPLAQRKFNKAWADKIAAEFDPEELGNPTVHDNKNGTFHIIDGQHRIAAMKQWLGDKWEEQQIQCWVYEDLSEAEQAEKFLKLGAVKTIRAFDKFRVAVTAGRQDEVHIEKILKTNGLTLSDHKVAGGIGAVTSLMRVYRRSGPETLDRALRIIRDSFGDTGFDSFVIDGIGHLCQRYNGQLDDGEAIEQLSATHAGVNGLLAKAEVLRKQTGNSKPLCIAAAAVEIINRRGKKLPSWWKQ